MTDSDSTDAFNAGLPWLRRCLFWGVSAVVVGLLFLGAEPRLSVLKNTDAKDCYYNLLIQGFREGRLNIKKDVPPGLARLANPYDPAANAPYIPEVGDISYYKGKLYLYFGVAPGFVALLAVPCDHRSFSARRLGGANFLRYGLPNWRGFVICDLAAIFSPGSYMGCHARHIHFWPDDCGAGFRMDRHPHL